MHSRRNSLEGPDPSNFEYSSEDGASTPKSDSRDVSGGIVSASSKGRSNSRGGTGRPSLMDIFDRSKKGGRDTGSDGKPVEEDSSHLM